MNPTSRNRGRGRLVALSNGAVAAALVALLAIVALVVKPPSPPGIAEFAPQASKPISKAPPGQASQFGTGPGACVEGQVCAAPSPSAARPLPLPSLKPPGVASPVQCYEWADGSVTQTFDPQSGPCMAGWPDADKGNGGATSPGVTRTAIRVGLPQGDSGDYEGIVRFLNTHFILYGRQIQLVSDSPTAYDPSGQAALAADLASKQVFASTEWYYDTSSAKTFTQRLVAEHILALSTRSRDDTSAQLAAAAPYRWSFSPTVDHVETAAAQFICGSLVGHAAGYGGPDVQFKPRSFAIVIAQDPSGSQPVAALRLGLSRCGAPVVERTFNYADATHYATDPNANARLTAMMVDLRQAGVTSVIPVAGSESQALMSAADNASYQPEWIWPGVSNQYSNGGDYGPGTTPKQSAHLMGIAPVNKVLPNINAMWSRAAGAAPRAYARDSEALYQQLLMLAVGVQAAGPHLTPATFQAGLQQLDFPNPGAAGSPYYQARVGFGPGDFEMIRDYGIWWYDNTQYPSYMNSRDPKYSVGGSGGYCWVGRGSRWALDHFPPNIRPFTGACR